VSFYLLNFIFLNIIVQFIQFDPILLKVDLNPSTFKSTSIKKVTNNTKLMIKLRDLIGTFNNI